MVLIISGFPEQPDPPTDLELTDQRERSVRLTWTPGDEHNSPIKCEITTDVSFVIYVLNQQKCSNPFVPGSFSVPDPV